MYKIIGKDGQQYGPASVEEMRRWLAENRVNAQTLVQAEGSPDWKPLSTFAEFAADLRTPPPVMPKPSPGQPPPFSAPQTPTESQARMWNMFCHLSVLSGYFIPFVIPFGNFLGPLLIWQIKKNEIPSVVEHGKAALNFQITVWLALLAGVAAAVVLSFICIGFLLVPVIIAVGLCGIIFPIIAGIKANSGEPYKYPWSLTLIS